MKRTAALLLTLVMLAIFLSNTVWGSSAMKSNAEKITSVSIKDIKQPHVSWELSGDEKNEFFAIFDDIKILENADITVENIIYSMTAGTENEVISIAVYKNASMEVKRANGEITKYVISDISGFIKRLDRLLTTKSQGYAVLCPSKYNLLQISDWARPIYEEALDNELIDGQIGYLTDNITREQFCDMLAVLLKKQEKQYVINDEPITFEDTENENIAYLAERNIIFGKSPEEFAPNDFLTREEAAVILDRAIRHIGDGWVITSDYIYFDDSDEISDWANNAIQIIIHLHIMNGVGDNDFAPKAFFTREQAISTIMRAYRLASL